MTKSLLIILIGLISFSSFSQINGIVKDDKNQTLPFVNIYVENTYIGTTSNEEGNYELNIRKSDTYTIVFQFLGYKTVKKTVKIETFPYTLDAILAEDPHSRVAAETLTNTNLVVLAGEVTTNAKIETQIK